MALWVNGNNTVDPATVADVLQAAGLQAVQLMVLAADLQPSDRLDCVRKALSA